MRSADEGGYCRRAWKGGEEREEEEEEEGEGDEERRPSKMKESKERAAETERE